MDNRSGWKNQNNMNNAHCTVHLYENAIRSTESCAINIYYIIQSKNWKETNNT